MPYTKHGFKDREEYLDSLADEYGQPKMVVHALADLLGPNEDFDGLINALEEIE